MERETYYDEDVDESVESVRVAVGSRIAAAEIGGISAFNEDERTEWLDGIDACETLEIALVVYDYLGDFISDGLEVVGEIHDQLTVSALPSVKRQMFMERAQIASYDSKRQLVREIKLAVDEAKSLQDRTLSVISDQALSVAERGELIKRLDNEGASSDLVGTAHQVVQVARMRLHAQQTVLRIEGMLHRGDADHAREVLGLSFGAIPLDAYVRLERTVSQLQIQESRLIAA